MGYIVTTLFLIGCYMTYRSIFVYSEKDRLQDEKDAKDFEERMSEYFKKQDRTTAEKRVIDAAMQWHKLDTSVNAEALHHYCSSLDQKK